MKNSHLFFLALIVSVCLLVFNGCSNEDSSGGKTMEVVGQITLTNDALFRTGVDTPENSANPYDQIGVKHNIVIADVMANATSLNTTDDYINYARTVSYREFGWSASSTPSPTNTQIINVINDVGHNFGNVISNSNFSTIGKQQLTAFINIMITANSNQNANYNDLKSKLVSFEVDLDKNSLISSVEKQNILQVTSVARHSAYYWYNDMLDAKEYNSKLPAGAQKRKWWQWAVVGLADALGGIAGAVVGSPTGIVAVGSAVIGAAGASGGAVTVIDYFWPETP